MYKENRTRRRWRSPQWKGEKHNKRTLLLLSSLVTLIAYSYFFQVSIKLISLCSLLYTSKHLIYSLLFPVLNIILDPLFILVWHWVRRVLPPELHWRNTPPWYHCYMHCIVGMYHSIACFTVKQLKQSLKQYIAAGGLVLLRTVAKVLAYSITARQDTLLGSVAAASYSYTLSSPRRKFVKLLPWWLYPISITKWASWNLNM